MHSFNRHSLIPVGLSLLVLSGCAIPDNSCTPALALNGSTIQVGIVNQPVQREYWPTKAWESRTAVTPDGCVLFGDLSSQIKRELPFANSFVVVVGGYIAFEGYYNGQLPGDLQLQQSIAKSVTSALVGIALDREEIPSLDVTIGEALPEYFEDAKAKISLEITLRDALMMRSGLAYDAVNLTGEFENPTAYDEFLSSRLQERLIDRVLDVPQVNEPGTAWQYNTSDAQLVSEIFQHFTGQPLSEYADEHLFAPLGIGDYQWQNDAAGVTVGGTLLWLRPLDMAKFGYLYLNGGVWDGEQIVPAEWIELSTQPQGDALNPATQQIEPVTNYGLQWWLWEPGSFGLPGGAYQALGYGGQMILVFPELDTVIVTTTNSLVSEQTASQQQRDLIAFIDQVVVPNLALQVER